MRGTRFRPAAAFAVACAVGGGLPEAQASATLFASHCGGCHNDSVHPKGLVYNAAGNAAIISRVNALGMGAAGSAADFASIADYLDADKRLITLQPVASGVPTSFRLDDIKVSGAQLNAHLKVIARIDTVSPPRKGTVTYRVATGFSTPSMVTYTPLPGQSGIDTWTYQGKGAGDNASLATTVRTASVVIAPATAAVNYTALWWNAAESGWGLNVNHQGDTLFATLFTYDASGAPMWLVMPAGVAQAGSGGFTGELYRTTGPAFDANPFTPIGSANVTAVGTMSLAFTNVDRGTLTYAVNGATVSKAIRRQVYGTRPATCAGMTDSRGAATNYQDLWWNPAESGWGVNVAHQDDTLFATLFTYDPAGNGLWLVMPAGARQADGSFQGELYRTRGPAFNAQPFTPIGGGDITTVGSMRFTFVDGSNGLLTYTYNGVSVSKSITRQVFASPTPSCS
jgi:hypothetical protein